MPATVRMLLALGLAALSAVSWVPPVWANRVFRPLPSFARPVSAPWAHSIYGLQASGFPAQDHPFLARILTGASGDGARTRLRPLVLALEARGIGAEALAEYPRLGAEEKSRLLDTLDNAAKEAALLLGENARSAVGRASRDGLVRLELDASAEELRIFDELGGYLPESTRIAVQEARADVLKLRAEEGIEARADQVRRVFGYMRSPTFVLVSAKPDSGHGQAARAIKARIERDLPEANVALLTSQQDMHPVVKKGGEWLYRKLLSARPVWEFLYDNAMVERLTRGPVGAFLGRIGARLAQRVSAFRPSAVVATQAMTVAALSAQPEGNRSAPLFAVLTDYTVNPFWIRRKVAHYFVPAPEVKAELARRGVPLGKITVTGIPIGPQFARRLPKKEARKRLGLDPDLPVVLVTGGNHGLGSPEAVLEASASLETPHQVVVVTGGNRELFVKLQQVYGAKPNVRILARVDDMDVWMSAADLMVGKPGGLTVSEALAKGLPLVILDPLPGQETRNTRYLVSRGAAVHVEDPARLRQSLGALLSDPDAIARLQGSAAALGRPEAASDIIATILRLLESTAFGGPAELQPIDGLSAPSRFVGSNLQSLGIWLVRMSVSIPEPHRALRYHAYAFAALKAANWLLAPKRSERRQLPF